MKSIWRNLSENQQDWIYTIIGLLIGLVGIGWIFVSNNTLLRSLSVFLGGLTGYFLVKGKLKPYRPQLIQRCCRCHNPMYASYKRTYYCMAHLEDKLTQVQAEKGELGKTEELLLTQIQAEKREKGIA